MTVATEYEYRPKRQAVGRAGHEGLVRNKRQPVCLSTRLQWMQTGGAVCSQQFSRQGLAFPRVWEICLKEKIVVKD